MKYFSFLLVLLWLLPLSAGAESVAFDAPGAFNPIVPGYFADPSIKKFGDLFYLYATTDGNGGGRGPSQVWVSGDFVNWTLVPMNWPVGTDFYWAPDIIKRPDGHFYLYYNQPCMTFGAVGDSPIGPWTPLGGGEGLVIPNYLVKNVITLDAQTFEDKTGDVYMYWGTWGIYPNSGCGVGRLNSDMKSFAKLGKIPNTQARDFFEGPYMLERNGVYYLMYSSGDCHNSTYRVQYAVGASLDGEFKMGPNNPVLSTSEDHTVDGPGHHSVLRLGDEYYIIYHRHDLPYTPDGMQRQVCADRLVFERDGVIKTVVPTHQGVGYLGTNSEPEPNLARGRRVMADSFYHDSLRNHDFKPEYAVDDNNATLWRPADNHMGHWLMVDLDSPQRIRRVLTQFEYATWFYQYLLEYSVDGEHWQVFADRRQNTRWGSPIVDRGDAMVRYLRLTITGVEKPGLFGAVWNLKVFADDRKDPMEDMADRAFFNDQVAISQATRVPRAWTATNEPDAAPLIYLEAAGIAAGSSVNIWTNQGTLGGEFRMDTGAVNVGVAKGRKAVRFSGREMMTASFRAPRALSGNNSFTVAAWVNNPEIAGSECLVSWGGHNGPDATTAQINYGSNRNWGAVGHWGFADMGFGESVPLAGDWHHLAIVYDGVVERVYVDGVLKNAAAKMLFVNEGEPIYLGASAPGTEFYDGYLASLRIFDSALSAEEIGKLYANAPVGDVLVQLDSARLDYGVLTNWVNTGATGVAFVTGTNPPTVEEVAHRMAVRFHPGQALQPWPTSTNGSSSFALVATIASQSGGRCQPVGFLRPDGKSAPIELSLPDTGWHQVVCEGESFTMRCYVDGKFLLAESPPKGAVGENIVLGGADFDGAVSGLQIYRHSMTDDEIQRLFVSWQREWTVPGAAFAIAPRALGPTVLGMTAQPSDAGSAGMQYDFIDSNNGSQGSGWQAQPFFLSDRIQPSAAGSYQLKVRDRFGNVSATSPANVPAIDPIHFKLVSDDFSEKHDYIVQGITNAVWNGLIGDTNAEIVGAGDGVLRLQSRNSFWDGNQPRGPFLYRNVEGDFLVQVKVADYAGLANRQPVGADDGGLMVRLPDSTGGENFVQLTFFPPWNQGNMWTSMVNGSRYQKGNMLGFDAHPYLQIIRLGTHVHFRTSSDGTKWEEMPESPVDRPDLAGKPVQVGLAHAAYGDQSSFISFSHFQLAVPK